LFALLQALVVVEAVSLEPSAGYESIDATQQFEEKQSNEIRYRQTTFSGVDCSSTHPPVDRVVGSDDHQSSSIDAMVAACQQVRKLQRGGAAVDESAIACLGRMIEFLETSFGTAASTMSLECAGAISPRYRNFDRRVARAARQYISDFEVLRHRLATPQNSRIDASSCLLVEQRLAEFVGQAVRYYLRLFLNPAPPQITTDNDQYNEEAFSKVTQHVKLRCATSGEEHDDATISALVSLGLLRLHEFLGYEYFLPTTSTTTASHNIPPEQLVFCSKPATNPVLPVRSKEPSARISNDELEDILSDIRHAMGFMAATKACRFLLDLLTKPAVQREIDRFGGWTVVERYASIARDFECWRLCPDDAHLVVLCDAGALLKRLHPLCGRLEEHVPNCETSLAELSKRFHTTTKSKNLLSKYPQIPIIGQVLSEGQERVDAFPLVKCKKTK
jgi:hypothetical protein